MYNHNNFSTVIFDESQFLFAELKYNLFVFTFFIYMKNQIFIPLCDTTFRCRQIALLKKHLTLKINVR
ncbi:MAG: hypothetical protein FNNCIFGK_00866 [Bacteroidia bacterium]|nr:hypothetical protein [Bacteroidia bacterium]